VWEATVDGRVLHFHLAGINNQNFIMRDEETGSWWQQVTGEAIFGPLKGRRLKEVLHDELSFKLWKQERPQGRVLRPDERVAAAGKYAPADWEERIAKMPVVTAATDERLEPRAIVVGISLNGKAKAYPLDALRKQNPLIDTLGGVPLLIVVGEDQKSVRAFDRTLDDRKLEFFIKPETSPLRLFDAETGSQWDFTGTATSGTLTGRQLRKVAVLNDYWFDWKLYHADTSVYLLGER
jgi:Protein of unknown function (DUF3179)